MRHSVLAIVLAIFAVLTSTNLDARRHSRASNYIRPGKTFNMPSIGLKGKLVKNAKATPIGSLEEKVVTRTYSNGKVVKITACFPEDLWKRGQLAGTWKHPLCTISIYRMTLPPPTGLKLLCTLNGQDYVLKESYEAWEKNADPAKMEWTDEKIAGWLRYLLKKECALPPEKVAKGPRNALTKRFVSKNDAAGNYNYVITSRLSPNTPYLIRYEFARGADNKKNIKVMLQSIASLSFSPPKELKESAKRKKISLKRASKNKKNDKTRSAKYLKSRRAVINSIKNMRDWWYLETENFIMVANIKSRATAKALAQNLERSRNLYTKIFPLKKPLEAVSVARMFATRQEYLNYVGPEMQWSGGIWMSNRKELAVSPMSWGTRRDSRKWMAQVTLHEAFHQYIYFAVGERQTSVWFNEGMAQFFEGAVFKSSKIHIKPLPRKVKRLPMLISKQSVENILKMPYREFYGPRKRDNYDLAWGILYFMLKGAPVMKDCAEFAEIPGKYYDAMVETGNPAKAAATAWKGVDTYKFAEKLKKFWNSARLVKRAAKFDPLKTKKR